MLADGHPLFPLIRTMRAGKLCFFVALVLLVFTQRWSVFVDFSTLRAVESVSIAAYQGASGYCKVRYRIKEEKGCIVVRRKEEYIKP